MTKEDEEEYLNFCSEAMFRIHILEQRLNRYCQQEIYSFVVSRNTGIPTAGALAGCGIFLESVKVTERNIRLIGAKLEIFKWYEEFLKSPLPRLPNRFYTGALLNLVVIETCFSSSS